MTVFCDICEKYFGETKEHFLVMQNPVKICSECLKIFYEDYQHMLYDKHMGRDVMMQEIGAEIEEADLSFADKKFMREILNAYASDNPKDEHNSKVRRLVDTLVFGANPEELTKMAIAQLDDNFSDEEKKKYMRLIEEYLSPEPENTDLVDLTERIAEYSEEGEKNEHNCGCDCDDDEAPLVISWSDDKLSELKKINMKALISKVLKFIKGQDEGVVQIGRLIYRHIMRCLYNESHPDSPLTIKENFIVVGPTGVGKTATIEEYCKLLGLPCVIVDMTAQTKAGYIGANIEDSFKQLLKMADNNLKLAQKGIMILDEGDKNLNNSASRHDDPGGTSVMFEMLKKIEGCDIPLEKTGVIFSSKDVLFICMGTFTGVYEARQKRKFGAKVVGFKSESKSDSEKSLELGRFIADDFVKSGTPQEWVGRFPAIVEYKALKREELLDILRNSSKSAFVQNKKLLEFTYGVNLRLTPEGENAIVEKALEYNVGARGLNRVITELLEDVESKLIMENEKCEDIELGKAVSYR